MDKGKERAEILRDLQDIARVANGPKSLAPPPPSPFRPLGETSKMGQTASDLSPTLTSKSLSTRDANAIQYTKSQLDEGDTLVYVRFPNGQPVYDATGFRLSDIHRVNSEKLKAASPIFKKALESDWEQHRARRRNKLLHDSALPSGIRYVLDLTPPDEGDDALALTAELSCSLGLRRWYKSEFSNVAAAHGLVGGEDETTIHPDMKKKPASEDSSPEEIPAQQFPQKDTSSSQEGEVVTPVNALDDPDVAFQKTLAESKRLHERKSSQQSDNTRDYIENQANETLDYCPIRHRTGIERLLQIVEGKNPRLDSAPKVWTLAVLAKHFECQNSIVDYVVTWMIAEPNCKIFEILPEDCLRIGMLLQNAAITRYAFTILVSEEALQVGTARTDSASHPNARYSAGKQVTKFGRPRESLDEDTLNLIQHAGRNFHARIEQDVRCLTDANMNWVYALPEFSKLLKIQHFLNANSGLFNGEAIKAVDEAIEEIFHYIRGRLLSCFYRPLDEMERKTWEDHRAQERHERVGSTSTVQIYHDLTEPEKQMTRYYWSGLRLLKWNPTSHQCATNIIRDQVWPRSSAIVSLEENALRAAEETGIPQVFIIRLVNGVDQVNKHVLRAIRDFGFEGGQLPRESYMVERLIPRPSTSVELEEAAHRAQKNDAWRIRQENVKWKDSSLNVPSSETEDYLKNWKKDLTASEKPDFWNDGLKAKDDASVKNEEPGIWNDILRERDQDIKDEIMGEAGPSNVIPELPNAPVGALKPVRRLPLVDYPYDEEELKPLTSPSKAWQKLDRAWKDSHARYNVPAAQKPNIDFAPKKNVSWGMDAEASSVPRQYMTRTYEYDASSRPHVPRENDIGRDSPFFNLTSLFYQIDDTLQDVCTRMLSRGEIQNLRPPTCDICDTLLCLGDDEYKFLPMWAGGLDDGTGGVFEEAIPPAERGGPVAPGPSYHTGSTLNSAASDVGSSIDFDGRSSVFGGDSEMSGLGVATSVGVEDGYSVDHVDRRRVFSESEFMTPGTSEAGESMVFVGDGAGEEMELPIRDKGKGIAFDVDHEENSMFGSNASEQAALLAAFSKPGTGSTGGKGKGKEVEEDESMSNTNSEHLSQAQKEIITAIGMDDDDAFFNTAGDEGDGDFDFESDSGDVTETEDDFEHV